MTNQYISKNRDVRSLLDRPRWIEWVDFEIRMLNASIPKELKPIEDFYHTWLLKDPTYFEGYVMRYANRPPGFHEIAELVEAMARTLPVEYHQYLHRGLTSSNVIDSCNHVRWNALLTELDAFVKDHLARPNPHGVGVMIRGMTHGCSAHRTTIEHRAFAIWWPDLIDWMTETVVGGPTGLGSDHRQAYQRYRYWPLWTYLAQVAACTEQLATDYRFYCSDLYSGVGVRGTQPSPTTSSAMPGKQNPSEFERLCSISHYIRSSVASQMMLPAQWLDRDLVHSAHERLTIDIMWDATFYMVEELYRLTSGTSLEFILLAPDTTSHDRMNQLLDAHVAYWVARKGAESFSP